MQRQDSHTSGDFSSIASDARSDGGVGLQKQKPNQDDENEFEGNTKAETTVFSVVYTILKENYDFSYKFAAATIVLQFLQLLMLLLKPAYGWRVDTHIWIWKAVQYVDIANFLISKGYKWYTAFTYFMLMATILTAIICTWIGWAFRQDKLKWQGPVKVARLTLTMCCATFYVSVIDALLANTSCNLFTSNHAARWHLMDFPDIECLAMPHIPQAGIAVLVAVLIFAVAFIMTTAAVTLSPISLRHLASQHSVVALRCLVCETIIVLASQIIHSQYRKLQTAIFLLSHGYMLWSCLIWEPLLNQWCNHARSAAHGGLSWVALMLVFLRHSKKHSDQAWQKSITKVTLSMLVPIMLACGIASYMWLRYKTGKMLTAFRANTSGKKLKDIYRFQSVYEVELAARCCRKWVDDEVLDPDAVQLAATIIKAGMARFPNNGFLQVLYANFLIDVQHSNQSGQSQLDEARKCTGTSALGIRYIIFVRNQQRASRSKQASSSDDSAFDLSSYVEFQRVFRQVLRSHKAAIQSSKTFWKLLLHHDVRFKTLTQSFAAIEDSEQKAERAYRTVLERYPDSARLLRCYGRFLEDVKLDPWGASKYFSEAEKLEEDDAPPQEGVHGIEDVADSNKSSLMTDKTHAIVLINTAGMIRMANKRLGDLFGYRKGELEGKNVAILMPPPFSQRHNTYIRNYVQTGKSHVIDETRSVLGLQKNGTIIPLKLNVSVVSGSGADSMFLGVVQEELADQSVVRCWMLSDGIILAIDRRVTDWFGKTPQDCVGKPFSSLGVDPAQTNMLMDLVHTASPDDFAAGRVCVQGVPMLHKFLDAVEVDVKASFIGTENEHIILMEMTRSAHDEKDAVIISDEKLNIVYASTSAAKMLGYQPEQMIGKLSISNLMNPPFSLLHEQWVQDMPAKVPANSCRKGVTVVALTSNGASLPVKLKVEPRVVGDATLYSVGITKSDFEEGLDFRRLTLHLDRASGEILEVNSAPFSLFGFKPAAAVGSSVSALVDVLEELVDVQCMPIEAILKAMEAREHQSPGFTWRVGVHPPFFQKVQSSDNQQHTELYAALRARQTRAALMQLQFVPVEGHDSEDGDDAPTHMFLHLYRADAMTGMIETDREGRIFRAGCCPLHQPGVFFGMPSSAMQKRYVQDYILMPRGNIVSAVLDKDNRKGVLKGCNISNSKLGPQKKLTGIHADGHPLTLKVQGCKKDASGRRMMLRVEVASARAGEVKSFKQSINISQELSAFHGLARSGTRRSSQSQSLAGGASEVNDAHNFEAACALDQYRMGIPVVAEEDAEQPQVPGQTQAKTLQFRDQPAVGFADPDPVQQPQDQTMVDYPRDHQDDAASMMSGSQFDGSATDQAAVPDPGSQVSYAKGKRTKRVLKLLETRATQTAIKSLERGMYATLGALLLVHLICFAVIVPMISSLNQYVFEVDSAGQANNHLHKIAQHSIVLRQLHKGLPAPSLYAVSEIPMYLQRLKSRLEAFDDVHKGLFLGFTHIRQLYSKKEPNLLQDVWEKPYYTTARMIDISVNPYYQLANMSLWNMGLAYLAAGREVYNNHARIGSTNGTSNTTDWATNRHWEFIVHGMENLYQTYSLAMNGLVERAMEQVISVNNYNIILLIGEGCVVCLVAVALVFFMLQKISRLRFTLVSAFLAVPAGFVRGVAFKQIKVDDDDMLDDSDSDDEQDLPQATAAAAAQPQTPADALATIAAPDGKSKVDAATALVVVDVYPSTKPVLHRLSLSTMVMYVLKAFMSGGAAGQLKISSKRRLQPGIGTTIAFLVPFILWTAACITAYIYSYKSLASSAGPLATNNISDRVQFRITRLLVYALGYVNGIDGTVFNKTSMMRVSTRLGLSYDALMFGSAPFIDSHWTTSGSAFQSRTFIDPFYWGHGKCMRQNKTTCLTEASEYYQISRGGLNNMLLRMVEEGLLLSRDAAPDINAANPRLKFIYTLGNYDMADGFSSASNAYTHVALGVFGHVKAVHVVLFSMSWVVVLLFLFMMFWPFVAKLKQQNKRVAKLLSQLPTDVDVEGILKKALGPGREDLKFE